MKVEFTASGDMGASEPPWQFWDGSAWSSVVVMFSSSAGEHNEQGGPGGGGGQETMRMGSMTGWSSKDLDGEDLYWVRFILPGAITTSPSGYIPTVSTAKSFTNEEGVTEFFGEGRPVFTFDLMPDGNSGLASSAIALSSGITVSFSEAVFPDAASSSKVFYARCPVGLDATVPLDIDITFVSDAAASGDVEWDVTACLVPTDDTVIDGALQEFAGSVVKSVDAANKLFMANLSLQVGGLFPGAILVLEVTRDAQVGNAEDTYADQVSLVSVECRGTKWKV